MVKLIGISGKAFSGKTTLVYYFIKKNPHFIKQSFAENVRHVISLLTHIDINDTRSQEDKLFYYEPYNKTIRQLLQETAEGLKKSIHPDIWVHSLFLNYKEDYWIIDDVRHENEIDMIRKHGGMIIRLEGNPSKMNTLNQASETALDHYHIWDLVIDTNQNDVNACYEQLCQFIL